MSSITNPTSYSVLLGEQGAAEKRTRLSNFSVSSVSIGGRKAAAGNAPLPVILCVEAAGECDSLIDPGRSFREPPWSKAVRLFSANLARSEAFSGVAL